MSKQTVVWVHGDSLSPYNPALVAYPDAPAVFIWDEKLLAEWKISLKRIMFMYECLLELDVAIRRGDPVDDLVAFAEEVGAKHIVTAESVSPRFRLICKILRKAGYTVEILPITPFADVDNSKLKLRSFSAYWRTAEEYAFE